MLDYWGVNWFFYWIRICQLGKQCKLVFVGTVLDYWTSQSPCLVFPGSTRSGPCVRSGRWWLGLRERGWSRRRGKSSVRSWLYPSIRDVGYKVGFYGLQKGHVGLEDEADTHLKHRALKLELVLDGLVGLDQRFQWHRAILELELLETTTRNRTSMRKSTATFLAMFSKTSETMAQSMSLMGAGTFRSVRVRGLFSLKKISRNWYQSD
jgi:hypothetical protein